MMKIKTKSERCENKPDHKSGMVTNQMIQSRMQEEIDELRAQPKYKRVDLYKRFEANSWDKEYNSAIDDIKDKYGDLYAEEK